MRKRLGYFTRGTFQYGDAVKIGLRFRCHLLTDPADIQHVLVRNAQGYAKGRQLSSKSGKQRAGDGLLTKSGADHRERRRLLQPLFHERSVESHASLIVDETQQLMARWQHGQMIDIAEEMAQLSRSILMSTVFGRDWNEGRDRLNDAIMTRRRYTEFLYHSRLPFRDRLPIRLVRDHQRATKTIDEIVFREIERRGSDPNDDFLSKLVDMQSPDVGGLDDQEIRDEVLTLTSAGHETTADTLAWSWYLIATHPEVESEWRNELEQVHESNLCDPPVWQKLAYTRMILDESNRLYPPTWLFARVPLAADTLPSGLSVDPSCTLLLCQYLMHRHPGFYSDPERFDPNRFRDPPSGSRLLQAYFPFGAGPHTCIGEAFSRMQSVLVLAAIGRRFCFQLSPNDQIVPEPGLTLYPRNGVRGMLVLKGECR
ncbi:MAG: cytochrome P450 [Planctomycetaceae bacterium]